MIDTALPEINLALTVVRQGAQLAQRVRSAMAMGEQTKDDLSPVTVADFASQALAAHAMQVAVPGIPLVGEECADELRTEDGATMRGVIAKFVSEVLPDTSEDAVCDLIDYGTGEAQGRFWTLDPIDGTKGYLRGGQYAVAFALIEGGQVQIGALGCPNLGADCQPAEGVGTTIIAKRGEGAWLSVGDGEFTRMAVSPCEDLRQARVMRSVEDSHTNAGQIDAINAILGVEAEPVRMDSQAKYGVLAAGGGELLFRLLNPGRADYRECIWDQAAGAIILEEAGGMITDLKGQPLDFSQGRKLTRNTGVFASNGRFHEAGLKAIAKVCSFD